MPTAPAAPTAAMLGYTAVRWIVANEAACHERRTVLHEPPHREYLLAIGEGVNAALAAHQPAVQEQVPSAPETTLTEDAIAARDAAMFVDGAAGPAASELLPLAKEASRALVQLAAARVKGWPEARIKALSASFRNFDRVVGLGSWLIGDALGLCR